jgi:hypothetical protein
MSRVKSYKKKIACLESLWDQDIETRLSVIPILELASKLHDIKFTHLTCNTREELKHNLKKLRKKRGYGILYLAFHGNPGEIILDESTIKIETIASMMGKEFANWIIHFGSCGTVDTEEVRITHFIQRTEVSMVVGYKKDVHWAESAAVDFLLLDWFQRYKDMGKLWKRFSKHYRGLISITGLKAFQK